MKLRIFLVLFSIVCAVGMVTSGADLYAARQASDRGDVIPQPDHWVAFRAVTTRFTADGQTIRGHFFRQDDGSELSVEEFTSPSPATIRHIRNYTLGRYFQSSKAGEWQSGPLPGAPGARALNRFFTKSMRPYRPRLALLAGQNGALQAAEGLEAWISTNDDGTVLMLAPSLNFFPVVSNHLNGRRRILADIRIEPVERSLFEPAAGDAVTQVTQTSPPSARPPVQNHK